MTVSTTLNKIIYSGNAVTTSFPFTFAFPGGSATQEAANIQVFFTDLNGNVTLLIQGLSSSNYQITFNPPTGTNPTPSGGSVTYNPLGVPIPLGTFLTILRTLPLSQGTSLANQGTLYQPVEEAALDYQMMVSQQVLEIQARSLVVPISDPTPSALPAAASRKLLFLAFDVNGNPIATNPGGASTPVSSAMAPVVAAASLAAGRTALGLGVAATEGIGSGLQDDGAGNLRTFFSNIIDAAGQSVVVGFHQNVRIATAIITYTFPLSSTLFNGFGFFIYATAGAVALTPNAADSFQGAATGASLVIPPGQRVFVSTNATGTWFIQGLTLQGFNQPLNLEILASVAGNALTIALKDFNGNDPSASSPILFTTSFGGTVTPKAITGPLSITVPNLATLGTISAQASRIWIGLFDNAGSPVLGVYNSLSGINILSWDENTPQSPAAISAGSTTSQTWFAASSLTTKSFKIIGFVESTQPTAGTWTATPTSKLFGPGVPRPGAEVQSQRTDTGSVATGTTQFTGVTANSVPQNTAGDQYMSQAITPSSPAHLLRIEAQGHLSSSTAADAIGWGLFQDSTAGAITSSSNRANSIAGQHIPMRLHKALVANLSSATTFKFRAGGNTASTFTFNGNGGVPVYGGTLNSFIEVREIAT